jgi:hypothetical protein
MQRPLCYEASRHLPTRQVRDPVAHLPRNPVPAGKCSSDGHEEEAAKEWGKIREHKQNDVLVTF